MSQDNTTQKAIGMGIALFIALVLGIAATTAVADHYTETTQIIDTEQDWTEYAETLTGVEVTSEGTVQLEGEETTGTYESVNIEEEADTFQLYVHIPEPEESSLELVHDTETYELEDGNNQIELEETVNNYEFDLEFDRTDTDTESPEADTFESLLDDTGLTHMIAGAAFTLLILLTIVAGYRER